MYDSSLNIKELTFHINTEEFKKYIIMILVTKHWVLISNRIIKPLQIVTTSTYSAYLQFTLYLSL
jgi:hypothetical protein